jgi:hypothetical protein
MNVDILYLVSIMCLIVGQVFNVFGTFAGTENTSNSATTLYVLSLPYLLVQRACTAIAIHIIRAYKYFTNNQIVMMILMIQFIITLIFSRIYRHDKIYMSDLLGCLFIGIGYYVHYFQQEVIHE